MDIKCQFILTFVQPFKDVALPQRTVTK